MGEGVRRALALLLLILAVAPGTWLRTNRPSSTAPVALTFSEISVPLGKEARSQLGPFRLESAWQMQSSHRMFGGYSALLSLDEGDFLAISDRGVLLRFSPPGLPQRPEIIETVFSRQVKGKVFRDFEAATRDPDTGTFWTALENYNVIARQHLTGNRLRLSGLAAPEELARWSGNSGPEAMVRLADGRFLILREAFSDGWRGSRHQALILAGDPVEDSHAEAFSVIGPEGHSPTDMAQLPDGRVLVLFRRLVWPLPARFACRLAIGDPADVEAGSEWELREVARLAGPLPVDNFEGLAIVPESDGTVGVWIISDDNRSAFQSTLLWKLVVDPADLSATDEKRTSKKAREQAARLSPKSE